MGVGGWEVARVVVAREAVGWVVGWEEAGRVVAGWAVARVVVG